MQPVMEDPAQQPDPAQPDAGGDASQAGERLADKIMAAIPPEYQSATERLALAGKKIMFDKKAHASIMAQFDKLDLEQEPGTTIATGVAALMTLIEDKVKGPLPPPAVMGASAVLLSEAINFLAEAGDIQETPELVAEAYEELIGLMMQKLNINPDDMPGVEPPQQPEQPEPAMSDPGMAGGVSPTQRGVMQ